MNLTPTEVVMLVTWGYLIVQASLVNINGNGYKLLFRAVPLVLATLLALAAFKVI